MRRALLAVPLLLVAACGGGASGVGKLRVVDADGRPLAGAEVLHLAELREEDYGGLAIPPLANAQALARARVVTVADGTADLNGARDGGLLVTKSGYLPGGFLLADELTEVDGAVQLALRPGRGGTAQAEGPVQEGGDPQPIRGLVLSTWLHNKKTTAFGHDLLLFAEETSGGDYVFPGIVAVPTPWTDGALRDVATIHLPGYSATGALRDDDGDFLVELGLAPQQLKLAYAGGEGLPPRLLVEVQAVAAAVADAVPTPGPDDPPLWCAYGAPLEAGGEAVHAVAAWEGAATVVFLLHLGDAGSHAFALPLDGISLGADAAPLDLTPHVRRLVAGG